LPLNSRTRLRRCARASDNRPTARRPIKALGCTVTD
jgi:hypothetical protein